MTDKELLELAAKAIGIELKANMFEEGDFYHVVDHRCIGWNPLTDDGDALRLAVKLKLLLGLESHSVQALAADDFGNFQTEVLSHRGDEAATRRAIVRAAAAIGEAMATTDQHAQCQTHGGFDDGAPDFDEEQF